MKDENNEKSVYSHHEFDIRLTGAGKLIGNGICNQNGEDLGNIKEIMLDPANGKVRYAILSFGGIFGIGNKLFGVPWSALKLDAEKKHFVLNMDKDRLNYMQGFDKNNWPDITTCF
ncbi:PRC-barrel domain-containing protein [Nitrosomonas sp. Nm166]|uniref:PRC-barrel domain-containing protein n=1 Tax=Nitrosomonas sp. Nm166 TaxID=1881054 RepID=UPI0008ED0C56|nr:PRC-barrel domain-containing protein [Nitrosomonas sp. Nm166]SFD84442.1 PRC-barrel domain-containing protein [Nitrosomonas sp. Nm166]